LPEKFLILIGDGMADWPIPSLGEKTPLEAARIPNMHFMASEGALGTVQVVPKEMYPGSDTSNLSILGYDPEEVYTGRSPLEAASIGVSLRPDDVAVRCNVVTLKGDGSDAEMEDFSGGHVSTAEATELLAALAPLAKAKGVSFHPGVSYRHLMVWPGGNDAIDTTPPHDIHGKKVAEYLPKGERADFLLSLMEASRPIFRDHPVNAARRAAGRPEANSIWLWGQGKAPKMPKFLDKFGKTGAVVAAVDLIKGIGIYAGLDLVTVPGATGYVDTNFAGKAEAALRALEEKDFVLVHVEAPDEAGHNGSVEDKVRSIERIDEEMLGPILARAKAGDMRVLLMPDHPTPIRIRTHAQEPVPFVMWPAPPTLRRTPGKRYTEADARSTGQHLERGTMLMGHLLAQG
jgi:2,3-bisphosphoglycerate-independent phosphoglycerate mutase